MNKLHNYIINIEWTGNLGSGTSGYKNYSRDHTISINSKQKIFASSDPAFQGDTKKYNPEDLFLSSISACHMLWYLHLCSDAGIIVEKYYDNAKGIMNEGFEEGGKFVEVNLFPNIQIQNSDKIQLAIELHFLAHKKCFIANSCNFPIKVYPIINT